MAYSSILRKSISKAAPLATKFIGSQKTAHFSTAAVAAAVNHAAVCPRFAGATFDSAGRRLFSSKAAAAEAASSDKKLIEILHSEIEVAEETPGKTIDAPAGFPFSIQDNPGEQTVTLTREYDGENITVEVSMPSLVTGEEDEDDENDDEDRGSESNVPLLVTVTKKDGNSPSLEFDCSAFPDEVRINSLSLKNPEVDDQLAYEGPDFLRRLVDTRLVSKKQRHQHQPTARQRNYYLPSDDQDYNFIHPPENPIISSSDEEEEEKDDEQVETDPQNHSNITLIPSKVSLYQQSVQFGLF